METPESPRAEEEKAAKLEELKKRLADKRAAKEEEERREVRRELKPYWICGTKQNAKRAVVRLLFDSAAAGD
jgi:hypothetical protein